MAQIDEVDEQIMARMGQDVWNAVAQEGELKTAEERRAEGKALRKQTPRSSHAAWKPAADRPDPVELLKSQNVSRVQALLPLRHERMSVSAFTFYRGGALIMASDLSTTPTTGIEVQACGDAHISNFGLFSSPERRTVFDINDFDETSRGPWEWDVKRLAASVEICGRDRDFSPEDRKAAVLACVRKYREAMANFSGMGEMDVWYAHVDIDNLMVRFANQETPIKATAKGVKRGAKVVAKAKAKDSARAIARLTEVVDGRLRIVSDPPVIVPLRSMVERIGKADYIDDADIRKLISAALVEYCRTLPPDKRRLVERYQGVDIAHKVVGVGSVGTRAFIVVMQGAAEGDHLVLQIKEAQESVLERFCGKNPAVQHGQRVVEGQRAMQTASDMLLGWCQLPAIGGGQKDYYVRQLWDGKGSINLSRIDERQLELLAAACGHTLAHAHARTGDRFAIAGYLGSSDKFDRAIAKFATAYADQNEADYERFMSALSSGELES